MIDETLEVYPEEDLVLTTIDNPYNPKQEYEKWKTWDQENGYNTEEYIARLINMESNYQVDDEFALNHILDKVMDDILANDDQEIYRLV